MLVRGENWNCKIDFVSRKDLLLPKHVLRLNANTIYEGSAPKNTYRAVVVLGECVCRNICIVDDYCACLFNGLDSSVESDYDRVIWLLGRVNHVARNPDALSPQAGKVAGGDVIRRCVPWLSQRVVVVRILASNGLKDVSCVFDRSCHWSYGVLALTDGDDQGSGGKSYGGLDAHEIAYLAGAQNTAVCF